MQSLYYRAFNFIDTAKPSSLGIYFSFFLHFLILLFMVGLPDFFKPNKLPMPQIIPIEILNISDITSITPIKEDLEININDQKKIKQKKFNSSDNAEVKKIDLQQKPKKKLNLNKSLNDETDVTLKSKTKQIDLNEKQITRLEKIETLKVSKIKPKLKPKSIEENETKNDIDIQNKTKPEIKKEKKKNIDKLKPIEKPEPDFNIASMLKDLRNEEMSNFTEDDNKDKLNQKDKKEKDLNSEPNLEVSISEMDLVIQQLKMCFNPRAGTKIIGSEMVKIGAKIDRNANVRKDTVQIIDTNISKSNPYYEAITESAIATLYNPLCAQLKLPLNKYETWKDLKITIDYSWIKN